MTDVIYPRLSGLVSLEALPEQLSFLEQGAAQAVDGIFYRHLKSHTSTDGSTVSSTLELISSQPLRLEVPGTGFALVLNAGSGGAPTVIPASVVFSLGIRRFRPGLRLANFGFSPEEIFELLFEVVRFSDEELILTTVMLHGEGEDPLGTFVTDLNSNHGLSIPLPLPSDLSQALSTIAAAVEAAELSLPLIVFLEYVLDPADLDQTVENLEGLMRRHLGGDPLATLRDLFVPRLQVGLELNAGIEFPRSVLRPMKPDADGIYQVVEDPKVKTTLLFEGAELHFDSRAGIGFDKELSAGFMVPHDQAEIDKAEVDKAESGKAEIGRTGLTLEVTGAKLDLSRKTTIPEIAADGRPDDFVGVFIEKASIGLPEKWFERQEGASVEIFGRRLIIGTGGISGRIGLEAVEAGASEPEGAGAVEAVESGDSEPEIAFKLGSGFVVAFRSFDIVFQQNAILESNVRGSLTIPGFEDANGDVAKIEVDVHFGTDGEFRITASEADGIPIRLAGVVEVLVRSLTVGRKGDRFYAAVSGTIGFLDIGGFLEDRLPKDIDIQKLLVWDDGNVEIEGGSLVLREPKPLKIPPVELTITALHLGAHEQMHGGVLRRYKYVGFDGGVSVKPGGVDARGDGFKFYFTVDNDAERKLHVFVRIESIAIDLVIPGAADPESAALLLSGYLSVKEPPPDKPGSSAGREYAGAVSFTLPKLKMGGSAALRYNPKLPSFLVDVGLELSTPIPLGTTGLGIYGFRGLVGRHFVASREEIGLEPDAKWYRYYKKKVPPENREGIQPGKFAATAGFSLGAGVSLATASDGGKAFSSKIFFLLSLPEVFLLEGQAQILKERIGLDSTEDPPFYALIAITNSSLEAALGVNYRVPDDGDRPGAIATVDGLLEIGFFFGNASAWYVNLGRESPDAKRIQVELLSLFDAYFYMMFSSAGIRAGAGASYEVRKSYGPIKAELTAYLDVAARISFERKQLGGSIQLGGSVGLKVFRFGFTISAGASLAAEAPRPFIVSGSVRVCVRVLRKERCVQISLTWTFDRRPDLSEIPVIDVSRAAKVLNIMTRETFPVYATESRSIPPPGDWGNLDDFVVPVDSFIDIELAKAVDPRGGTHPSLARLGGVTHAAQHVELIPPQRGRSPQVKHEFAVERVEVKCWRPGSSGGWQDYDVYEAVTPMEHLPGIAAADLAGLKQGFWQMDHPSRYNKLRLLSQTPFSYVTQGAGGIVTEELGVTAATLFCADEKTPPRCVLLADVAGPEARLVPRDRPLYSGGALFRLRGGDGEVIREEAGGFARALGLKAGQRLDIDFPEPVAELSLRLRTIALDVTVRYFRRVVREEPDSSGLAVFDLEQVEAATLAGSELAEPVVYDRAEAPVDRVSIEAGQCPAEAPPLPGFVHRYRGDGAVGFSGLVSSFASLPGDPNRARVVAFGRIGASGLAAAFDPEGGVLWSRRYTPQDGAALSFASGVTAPGGDLLLAGSLAVGRNRRRHLLARLSADGTPLWSFTYGHPQTRFHTGLVRTSADGLVLAGWNNRRSSIDDVELVQIVGEGRVRGAVRVGHTGDDQVAGILPFGDGFLIYGETGGNGWDGFLGFFDSGLDPRWGHRVSASRFDSVRSVVPLSTVEFLIAGVTSPAGSPTASASYVMRLNRRSMDQPALVFDLFPGVADMGSMKLAEAGGELYLLARAGAKPGHSRLLQLEDAPSIRWSKRLDVEGDHLLADLLQDPQTGAALVAAGRWSGGGEPPSGLLVKTDEDFLTCATVAEDAPATTAVTFTAPKWQPRVETLEITTEAVTLEVTDADLQRASLCPPVCTPDAPSTFLHELCYLPRSAFERDRTVVAEADVKADNDAMLRRLRNAVQPIWRPATTFAIRVQTVDRVSAATQSEEYRRSYVFGFRTAGPVGHFHRYLSSSGEVVPRQDYEALAKEDREDQYKLASLRPYIDYRRSYPNADGRLTLAKPVFYAKPRLLLFFLQDYVYSMYGDWDPYQELDEVTSVLEAVVLDPLDSATQPARFEMAPTWERNHVPRHGEDAQIVENLFAQGEPCTEVEPGERQGVHAALELPDLKPSKAYTVRLDAVFSETLEPWQRQEVHRYVFQTSRYADFAEQVYSYRLVGRPEPGEAAVEAEAIYEIVRSFDPAAIQAARAVLAGTADDALVQRFADPFDRLLTGALGIGELQPPETTELNVLRHEEQILGLLVRSPEPFNDPKLPPDELEETVTLAVDGGGDFQAIFARDGSQVFLTDGSGRLRLPTGSYRLTFEYRQFDGEHYAPVQRIDDVVFEVA